MTTVAYRDGVMASDSSCWFDGVNGHDIRKVHRVGGGLVGYAGSVQYGLAMVRWLADGADDECYPKEKGGFVIVVDKRGRITSFESESSAPCRIRAKFLAIGSGAAVALGAMAAGADAKQAVRIACQFDAHTKGPVKAYKL